LWRRSNETFVPALEPLIFIYVSPGVLLTLLTGTFINNQFSDPEAALRKRLRLFQWWLSPRNGPSAPGANSRPV
jgi:hypothetical protein